MALHLYAEAETELRAAVDQASQQKRVTLLWRAQAALDGCTWLKSAASRRAKSSFVRMGRSSGWQSRCLRGCGRISCGEGTGVMRILNTMLDKNWTEPLPIYAWVIEHPEGLIVVDTGETAETAQPGYFPSWHPYWKNVREWVREEEEIGPRMRAIGLSPDDVRWVIMTHLHPDHAGGMFHFPKAHFLISPAEYRLASGFSGQMRGYLPQHFPTWLNPDLVAHNHAPVGPFSESFQLTRAADVFIVPTVGHSGGHQSVVLFDNEEVFFLAGDTSYTQQLMLDQRIDGVSPQEQSAHETLSRILAYARQVPLVYLPSHDPESAKRLSNRQPVFPPVIKQLAAVPV